MNIVVLGDVCLMPGDLARLHALGKMVIYDQAPGTPEETISRIQDAHIVISHLTKIPESVIAQARNLKMICLAVTGCDSVDLAATQARGIVVCYAPGYATQAVAEHTMGLMLAVARQSFAAAMAAKAGVAWSCAYVGKELRGKTLGILGYGNIGRAVALIAQQGFGMQVTTYDAQSTAHDLEVLLATADVISVHLPLTSKTRNMINADFLVRAKWGVLFINTARGELVDEQALLAALESGHVAGAGLDVLVHEPMQPNDSLVCHPRVIVTPHIAYNTTEALVARSHIVVENVVRFVEGKPQHVVGACF